MRRVTVVLASVCVLSMLLVLGGCGGSGGGSATTSPTVTVAAKGGGGKPQPPPPEPPPDPSGYIYWQQSYSNSPVVYKANWDGSGLTQVPFGDLCDVSHTRTPRFYVWREEMDPLGRNAPNLFVGLEDGSGAHDIITDSRPNLRWRTPYASLSYDDKRILMAANTYDPDTLVEANGGIYVSDLQYGSDGLPLPIDMASATRVTTPEGGSVVYPCLSPDGTTVVYEYWPIAGVKTDMLIYAVDVATGATRLVIDTGNSFQDTVPQWSPDGTRIAFTMETRKGKNGPVNGYQICTIRADGSDLKVAVGQANTGVMRQELPAWSPDGQWIVCQAVDSEAATRTIVRNAADGTGTAVTVAPEQSWWDAAVVHLWWSK